MEITAPAKIILLGEHAVVYGKPAIAVPVPTIRATAIIKPGGHGLRINAQDLQKVLSVDLNQQVDDALVLAARMTLEKLCCPIPNATITLHSTIPLASGFGSGAAISTALARAIALACQLTLDNDTLNELIFEIEKHYHGTPSGIDNTVIVYEKPVFFIRNQPIRTLQIGRSITLVIGDTGKSSLTRIVVSDVRQLVENDPDQYKPILTQIGKLVENACHAMANGDIGTLGSLMNNNHSLLQELTVSSPELDHLVEAACEAGAYGAKLSGSGRGGNMIALIEPETVDTVRQALIKAGAARVFVTTIKA